MAAGHLFQGEAMGYSLVKVLSWLTRWMVTNLGGVRHLMSGGGNGDRSARQLIIKDGGLYLSKKDVFVEGKGKDIVDKEADVSPVVSNKIPDDGTVDLAATSSEMNIYVNRFGNSNAISGLGHGINVNVDNPINRNVQFLPSLVSGGSNLGDKVDNLLPVKELNKVDGNPWKWKPYIRVNFDEKAQIFAKDGKTVKLVEDNEVANSQKLRNSLVIKVFGKEIPSHVIAWEVRRQWKIFGKFHFTTLGSAWFLCSFASTEMMEGVLSGGPWFVNGSIVEMEKWSLEFSTLSLKGLTSPIWIRMPHLPLQCWDEVNVARITSSIGNMFQWGKREFAKIYVRVRLDQCLPTETWVESISGRFFKKFEYEKISTLCYGCGLVGHLKNDCRLKAKENYDVDLNLEVSRGDMEMGEFHEEKCDQTYGPWIMVKKKVNRKSVFKQEKPFAIKKHWVKRDGAHVDLIEKSNPDNVNNDKVEDFVADTQLEEGEILDEVRNNPTGKNSDMVIISAEEVAELFEEPSKIIGTLPTIIHPLVSSCLNRFAALDRVEEEMMEDVDVNSVSGERDSNGGNSVSGKPFTVGGIKGSEGNLVIGRMEQGTCSNEDLVKRKLAKELRMLGPIKSSSRGRCGDGGSKKKELFVRMMGIGWDFFILPLEGRSGGIMVLWKSDLASFSVLKTSDQCVIGDLNVFNKGVWMVSIVYASKETVKRRLLWEVVQEASNSDIPSIVGGEFNCILSQEDKKGGRRFKTNQGSLDMLKFMNENDYHEVSFVGPRYTWCNNKSGGGRILERLDRCMLNTLALNKIQITVVKHLARVSSDHCPIVLKMFEMHCKGRSGIKFEDTWLSFKTVEYIVSSRWKRPFLGNDMEVLNKKFKKTLRNINWISQVKDANGVLSDDPGTIEEEFMNFFQEKWEPRTCSFTGWPKPWSSLLDSDKDLLNRELNEEKISKVILNLGNNRAPCLDGISYSFLKAYWKIIKVDVVRVVQQMVEIMPRIISEEQAAFVKGRSISDHHLLVQEIISKLRFSKARNGFLAIKVDMEQAYDSMCWATLGKEVGIRLSTNAQKISHLLFADDILLFLEAKRNVMKKVRKVLEDNCKWTGQNINYHKSSLVCGNSVDRRRRIQISRFMGIKLVDEFEYLRIKLALSLLRKDDFQCLLDKSYKKINVWSNRDFIWNKSDGKKGLHYLAWDYVCKPKEFGGWGVQFAVERRDAMRAKFAWKLIDNPESLLSRQLNAKYGESWGNYQLYGRSSSTWKILVLGWNAIRELVRWKVADGFIISVLKDIWILDKALIKWPTFVATFEDEDVTLDWFITEGNWDRIKLRQFFGTELVDLVCMVPISPCLSGDSMELKFNMSGKSISAIIMKERNKNMGGVVPFNWIYKLKLNARLEVFLWRLFSDALPTAEFLYRRKLADNSLCPMGCEVLEDCNHIATCCCKLRKVLDVLRGWGFQIPIYNGWFECLADLKQHRNGNLMLVKLYFTVIWFVWSHRNKVKHGMPEDSNVFITISILNFISQGHSLTFQSGNCFVNQSYGLSFHKWQPPPPGWIKINVDASLRGNYEAGIGGIVKDSRGRFLLAFGRKKIHWDIAQLEMAVIKDIKKVL
ncbi:hypothetical protein KFK09_017724 [Dendrobium nobile]|uniref:CCHC-type domain-containing protein n=1 Tax=Dendrobium nobile TaxID=94219 RepID=A0A8T3ATR2_DENNO|nr:hypothetical protein KFK09_017724 [Dendrobium nobile]